MLDGKILKAIQAGAGAIGAVAVTPHDSTNFARGVCDRLFVGTGGTVTVVFSDDSTCQYTVADGTWMLVRAKRVNSTGTTATAIVAEYTEGAN